MLNENSCIFLQLIVAWQEVNYQLIYIWLYSKSCWWIIYGNLLTGFFCTKKEAIADFFQENLRPNSS